MQIRFMNKNDIDTIVFYETKIFGNSLGKDMLENELKNSYATYFVMEDETFIGYISTWVVFEMADILNFFIVPKYQNKGYGKKLFSHALDYIKKKGAKTVALEVRESNNRAINLYKSFGFKVERVREKYYKDEDALLMIGVL